MHVLELINVTKRYVDRIVLENFNLTIDESEVVRLEGPNGSGKTTVVKLACGLERPTRGQVRVLGMPPNALKAKRAIGAVLHSNMTYPELTVKENLLFFAKLYGVEPKRALRLAERVGLHERFDQPAGELSFGWRKRLETVRALLHSPKLLILDEPFVGLDSKGKNDVINLLNSAREEGTAILYTAPSGTSESPIFPDERVVSLSVN